MTRLTAGKPATNYLCNMETDITRVRDLYFTAHHDWIDFTGLKAYTGITGFKLLGFRAIDSIKFHVISGFKQKGDIIATICYRDYQIEAQMPVNGKVLLFNQVLQSENRNLLLQEPENDGWIALILPAEPNERKGLLLPEDYRSTISAITNK